MKIYRLYSEEEAAGIAESIRQIDWHQGKAATKAATGSIKKNLELKHSDSTVARKLLIDIHERMSGSGMVGDFFVDQIMVPKFNWYGPGDAYHEHADAGLMGGSFRTDLACTLFLTEGFDGGELIVNDCSIVCRPGEAIVYECWRPHRVNPVISGDRICAITWLSSLFRDFQHIEIVGLLRSVLMDIDRSTHENRLYSRLSAVYGKLTKMWAR